MTASGALVQNITEDAHFAIDEDRPIHVTVTDDGTATGAAVDISGYAMEFGLMKPDGTAAFTKTVAGGGITVDANPDVPSGNATSNRANIAITDGDKAGLAPGNGYSAYLRRTDDGNEYFIWVAERVALKQYK